MCRVLCVRVLLVVGWLVGPFLALVSFVFVGFVCDVSFVVSLFM